MTTYKGIRGHTIRTVAGDISPVALGDIWYNNVAKAIKVGQTAAAAWASGGDLNQARGETCGCGLQTAAMIIGGDGGAAHPNPTPAIGETEIYDGSSWTESSDLNKDRDNPAGNMGTTTAALVAGGGPQAAAPGVVDNAETWNGASWTEVGDLNQAKAAGGGSGTSTAAIHFGGGTMAALDTAETWDGSSWTEVADLNTAKLWFGNAGDTSTAALAFGGNPGDLVASETWNGTAWTEGANLNTGRRYPAGTGSSTLAMGVSGYVTDNVVTNVEQYDGSSWTEIADVSLARFNAGAAGTTSAGLIAAGSAAVPAAWTPRVNTEEFTGAYVAAATVTSS
jgi:hypothetical protein